MNLHPSAASENSERTGGAQGRGGSASSDTASTETASAPGAALTDSAGAALIEVPSTFVATAADRRTGADPDPIAGTADPVLAPLVAIDTGPAQELAQAGLAMGTAHPDELPDGEPQLTVRRTFCFVDLSGFTAFTRLRGPHEAVTLLAEFRRILRSVAAKRGVRLAKWLGDGAMLVATRPAPVVALGAHMIDRYSHEPVQLRVGAATGEALLFEGDDYIGEPVNLAAKLCASAKGGEMLAVLDEHELPDWVSFLGRVTVNIRGVGRIGGVSLLKPENSAHP